MPEKDTWAEDIPETAVPESTVVLTDLPTNVRGFVCLGEDYTPCIFINSRLSQEQQRTTYNHEMKHLVSGEFDDEGYVEYE